MGGESCYGKARRRFIRAICRQDVYKRQILSWVNESEENRRTLQKEHRLFDIALFTNTKINNKGEKVAVGTHILPMIR